MKAGLFAVAAAMAAGVSAKGHKHGRHAHEIFHAERGVANETCVAGCTTIYTTLYGEATLHYPTSTSTPAPTYAPATVPYVTTSCSEPSAPAPTYAASPPPPAHSSPPSTGGYTGGLGTSGKKWAVTYSPFTSGGLCKDAGGVMTDIAAIAASGYSSVRIYASVCSGLENVGAACEAHGLKMIIGVFIDETGIGGGSGAAEDVSAILAWGKWSLVELIVIGNEAIFNNYCSGSELAGFISSSKSSFKSAGYTGPCTTTEPLDVLQANTGALCEVLDLVGCNIHPYFNGEVYPSDAGKFVKGQLDLVDGLCSGKTGINLETGWPHSGNPNGVSIPSTANQLAALESIAELVGGKSVVLSFFDDLWKGAHPGSCNCEPYFGISEIASEY